MEKEFISGDMIRDNALKLVHHMYKDDGFVPDVIYASLRGGAYMANVFSEYYKMVRLREHGRPVFYAAVVARSYGFLRDQSKVMVDGWTYSPIFFVTATRSFWSMISSIPERRSTPSRRSSWNAEFRVAI